MLALGCHAVSVTQWEEAVTLGIRDLCFGSELDSLSRSSVSQDALLVDKQQHTAGINPH